MSFSVGDFIAITEKAFLVYEKCATASDNYAGLAKHVEILRNVMIEVQTFTSEGNLPRDERKVQSLVAARNGCSSILEEVDEFLEKHKRMARGSKRWIDTLKFITKDVEGLKLKLDHSTALLQLSLASLTSLSMKEIQRTLKELLRDYQRGLREPTVVSRALIDNEPVSNDELFEQLANELEDKDVHPDSINLNRSLIMDWISETTAAGDVRDIKARPPTIVSDAGYGSMEELTNMHLAPAYTNLSLSSVIAKQDGEDSTLDYVDGSFTIPVADGRNLSDSRSGSVSSHRSKPENWRPYDGPDPEYVFSMLSPFLSADPSDPPHLAITRHRILRAFHQQDWTNRGYLTRSETIQLCIDLLQRSGVHQERFEVDRMVRSFDRNRDGQIEKTEFTDLMDHFIRTTADLRLQDVRKKLANYEKSAPMLLDIDTSNLAKTHGILPWGWTVSLEFDGSRTYWDRVTSESIKQPPEHRLENDSFAMMAMEADLCVEAIDNFERKWLGIVPRSLQSQFIKALAEVRAAALEFVFFEKDDNRGSRQPSNYDALLRTWQILCANDVNTVWTSPLRELQSAQRSTLALVNSVLGFCQCLTSFEVDGIEATAQSFPRFHLIWKNEQVHLLAYEITQKHSKWLNVKSEILRLWSQYSGNLEQLETRAFRIAREHYTAVQDLKTTLNNRKWNFKMGSTEYRSSRPTTRWTKALSRDSGKLRLRIEVDDPPQNYISKTTGQVSAGVWCFDKELETPISLLPGSVISFEISEYKDNSEIIKERGTFDVKEVGQLCRFARIDGAPFSQILHCEANGSMIKSKATMLDQQKYVNALHNLQTANMSDVTLLTNVPGEDLLTKIANYVDPKSPRKKIFDASKPLPTGWERRFDSDGRQYFANHINKTTHWVAPTS